MARDDGIPKDRPTTAASPVPDGATDAEEPISRFSKEEEAELVTESNAHKADANALFSSGKYNGAITEYEEALAICPYYLDFERAVLKSNISACHLKLEEWKEAMSNATAALEGLDKLERQEREKAEPAKGKGAGEAQQGAGEEEEEEEEEEDDVEEVIVSSGAAKAGPALANEDDPAETARRKRADDVARIKAKALMRRARARSELGGWSNLSGAEEDYKVLSTMANLSTADKKLVNAQLRSLPARTKAAQEKEMGEMWGKLKDLGNGILKPFGLSTDNFQMVQDEKTGGYSMNFKSNNHQ